MQTTLRTLLSALLLAAVPAAQVGTPSTGGAAPTTGPVTQGEPDNGPPPTPGPGTGHNKKPFGGPGDTQPPSAPTDGTDPEGSGTPPGADSPGQPKPGDGPGVPGGAGGPPPVAGPGPANPATTAAELGLDLATWNWWWELNKEPFLVRTRWSGPSRPVTGDGTFLGQSGPVPGAPPTDEVVFGKILPTLQRTLTSERSDELLASSALALARIGASRPKANKSAYAEILTGLLRKGDSALVETATLALGILGDEASAPLLADLCHGGDVGREALGGRRPSRRTQTFAAYALGLLGNRSSNEDVRRFAVHQLVWALETDRGGSADLPVACVNAIGLIPIPDRELDPSTARDGAQPPGSSLVAQVDYLLEVLLARRGDARVRAQAPIAIGRLLQASKGPNHGALKMKVVHELFDRIVAHRREPREVLQSCLIALGQIGDNDGDELDKRIRRTLMRLEDLAREPAARQYALISLGRIGARPGEGKPDNLQDERNYLEHKFGRGSSTYRPWAALALGLWEHGAGDDDGTRLALRVALDNARVGREVGSYALACGLARTGEEALLAQLEDRGEEQTRGYVALGLGLTGSADAEAPLLELLPQATFRPTLLRSAALGVELSGSSASVPPLVQMLERSRSGSSQVPIAMALARSGDSLAVDPLLELLDNRDATGVARAFAASALGWIASRERLPWNALYSIDANVHAAPETLFDPDGTGLLNLF